MDTETEVEPGNLEFLILSDLDNLRRRAGGPLFPQPAPGESLREALGRRFAEVRPLLSALCDRLAAARAEGRV